MPVTRASLSSRNRLFIGVIVFVITQALDSPPQIEAQSTEALSGGLLRKSIVFDLKTPKVFYCPQEKPSESDKMIVKARPLDRLCEFEGEPKPKKAPSDCYNDVDETEFACDEKKRFMIRLDLASEPNESTHGIHKPLDSELDYILSKGTPDGKKKASPGGKKY